MCLSFANDGLMIIWILVKLDHLYRAQMLYLQLHPTITTITITNSVLQLNDYSCPLYCSSELIFFPYKPHIITSIRWCVACNDFFYFGLYFQAQLAIYLQHAAKILLILLCPLNNISRFLMDSFCYLSPMIIAGEGSLHVMIFGHMDDKLWTYTS